MRWRRPIPAIPARRWRWRRWPTRCGSGICATTRHDPAWPNRDRFVLSGGHASMLLYSMLHLADVREPRRRRRLTLDDIKNFRQLGQPHAGPSRILAHAGRRDDHRAARPGLRQRASAWRSARAGWRTISIAPDLRAVRLSTCYAICSDGDMMEGVSSEAASLAGHLQALATCAGSTTATTSPSKATPSWPSARTWRTRFSAYGWNVLHVTDANDTEAIERARCRAFEATSDRPTLIIVRQPHRLRRAAQAGHQAKRTASRSARRNPLAPRSLWLARGCAVSGAGRRARAFRRGIRQARRARFMQHWDDTLVALSRRAARAGRTARAHALARTAAGLGQRHPFFPRRRQRRGDARNRRAGAERHRTQCAVAGRRRRPTLRRRPRR